SNRERMSRRVYPTDPTNLLSTDASLAAGQQPMMGTMPPQQQQQGMPYGNDQSNMMMQQQQQYPQQQQQQYPQQQHNPSPTFPPAVATATNNYNQQQPMQPIQPLQPQAPPPAGGPTPQTTFHTSKRHYVVDPDNATPVVNAMSSMSLGEQNQQLQQQQMHQQQQQQPYSGMPTQPTYPVQSQPYAPQPTYTPSPAVVPTQPYQPQQPVVPQQPYQPVAPQQHATFPGQQQQQQQQQQYGYTGQPQQQQQQHQGYTGAMPVQGQTQQPYQQQHANIPYMPNPMQMATQPMGSVPYHSQQGGSGGLPTNIEQTMPTPENLCPKSYLRMSMNAIPSQASILSKIHIPLGCSIHPFANDEANPVPVISSTIVRCKRCRAYINPFVTWLDGGGRWKCNVCDMINDTPQDYFSPIDLTTGKRADIATRPELQRGCAEFLATSEYTIRAPQPPVYFFVIDVCYESIVSGMLNTAIEAIKASLDNLDLPGDTRTRVGFMTFDDSLHFYNLKSSYGRPQMYVVTEMDSIFVPPFEEFLVNLKESRAIVDSCLDIIKQMERKTQKVESCLGSALKAAFQICQKVGGKIVVLQSYIPRGPFGKLPIREFQSLLGTKKETQLLQPQDAGDFYKELGLNCSSHHLSVDLFLFATDYVDVASLCCLPQITGGELFYYPAFVASRDGQTFAANLMQVLTRPTGWESVMRVRTSRGLTTNVYHGNYFLKSSDLLSLPTIDAEKSFTLQMGITDNITSKYVAVQCALLYTHSCGERRVRVYTVSIPVVVSYAELFKQADISVVASLISKMAIDKALASSLSDAREAIANKCVDILTAYRNMLTSGGSQTSNSVTLSAQTPKLQLPESLKHLPLYVVAMVKSIVFTSRQTHPDMRAFHMHRMKMVDITSCLNFFYPQFYSLIRPPQQADHQGDATLPTVSALPTSMKLSSDQLSRAGIFILVNGFAIYMYVGEACPPETIRDVFGCDFVQLDALTFQGLPTIDNDNSRYARKVLEMARSSYPEYQRISLVKSNDKQQSIDFTSMLIEDRTPEGGSYYEFIMQLQNRLQQ
ncbi:hypothetical protein SAMD00019534_122920, partial [Acytostelium subglobosum LB1]|uniref:hypothetical protein n=1 Tax=Acytostelium subglobosum LB1 TaxID=1410327 RepID=UPI000644B3F5